MQVQEEFLERRPSVWPPRVVETTHETPDDLDFGLTTHEAVMSGKPQGRGLLSGASSQALTPSRLVGLSPCCDSIE
jgi:hypothetical protein